MCKNPYQIRNESNDLYFSGGDIRNTTFPSDIVWSDNYQTVKLVVIVTCVALFFVVCIVCIIET